MKEKPKHIGAVNELKAAVWLLNQGYEVFRNVSSIGPIDLIAVKEGEETLFLDVKGASRISQTNDGYKKEYLPKRFSGLKPHPNTEQIKLCVKFLCVGDNGEFVIVTPRKSLVKEEEVPLEDRVGWKFG